MAILEIVVGFLISLLVSAIIIYLAAKLLGETEGFGTAILVALIGSVIFAIVYYFLGVGWIAAIVGGLAWLFALGSLYKIGWVKSFFIAVVIWLFATFVGWVLPNLNQLI